MVTMDKKKKVSNTTKRDRTFIEFPPGGRKVWRLALSRAVVEKKKLGEYVIQALVEKLEKDAPELLREK